MVFSLFSIYILFIFFFNARESLTINLLLPSCTFFCGRGDILRTGPRMERDAINGQKFRGGPRHSRRRCRECCRGGRRAAQFSIIYPQLSTTCVTATVNTGYVPGLKYPALYLYPCHAMSYMYYFIVQIILAKIDKRI